MPLTPPVLPPPPPTPLDWKLASTVPLKAAPLSLAPLKRILAVPAKPSAGTMVTKLMLGVPW